MGLSRMKSKSPAQQLHLWYVPKITASKDLNRYLYPHVHSSIIPVSQKVEIAKTPINR